MALDFSQGGYEHLFKAALLQGINLFCGAGFSVEAVDRNGLKLPVAESLLNELKKEFPVVEAYTNLPRACTKITKTDKQSFYSFLQSRFSVKDFDPAYMSLPKIRIKNIYTTNIDDLFFKIFERAEKPLYLTDCSIQGSSYNDEFAIHYFPVHGCIRNGGEFVFGATEIAGAFSQRGNEKSWRSLAIDAAKHPILFWGWNFDDSGPIEAMYKDENDVDNNTNRWVLLRNPNEETIDYIKSLKFNIIIGDTQSMLAYLSDFVKAAEKETTSAQIDEKAAQLLKAYEIPENNKELTSYPFDSFFLEYAPRWSHIYSQGVPKTINYKRIAESIASGKNTVAIGMRCSGKTTLMMQLLVNYETSKKKHFLIAPSNEQVKTYIKILGGRPSLLFVDDCFRDTNAMITLFQNTNIQVVCFDRDFNYERQYHKIQTYPFELIDVTEISKEDAQSIVNKIPPKLKYGNAGTKNFEKDPTILSLLAKNMKSMNFKFMPDFYKKDPVAAKVFLMIVYVHACGTPCSFDMIYSFLGDDQYTWQEMYDIVNRAGGLIKDASDWFKQYSIEDGIQNYYQCRTRFLAEKIINSIPKGDNLFAEVLNEFTKYVPIYKICQYDRFKRAAYDADFAIRAFPRIQDGVDFYEICAKKDDSEYIYQQAAIYLSKQNDYKKAFSWIERARNLAHYNRFSIDSTYAKIYFDVNLQANQEQAKIALDILSDCCKNDKRRSIHYAEFAKRSIEYYKEYKIPEYLFLARSYIEEGLDNKNLSLSKKNKDTLIRLQSELDCYIRREAT